MLRLKDGHHMPNNHINSNSSTPFGHAQHVGGKSKDYAFWHQFKEKLSVNPGCPECTTCKLAHIDQLQLSHILYDIQVPKQLKHCDTKHGSSDLTSDTVTFSRAEKLVHGVQLG